MFSRSLMSGLGMVLVITGLAWLWILHDKPVLAGIVCIGSWYLASTTEKMGEKDGRGE